MSITAIRRSLPAMLVAATLALGTAGAAHAQTTQEGAEPRTDWSEQELQSFASAAVGVDEVFARWREDIAEAETAEEANEMQQQASEEAAGVVQDEGLSIEEYNEINQAIQADPELYEQVIELIEQEQQ